MSTPLGIPTGHPGASGGPPGGIPAEALIKQKQGQAVLIWAVGAFVIYISPVGNRS